jgi:hypothetical protein
MKHDGERPQSSSSEEDEPSTSQNISRQDRYRKVFRELENINEEFGIFIHKMSDDYIEVCCKKRIPY